MPSRSSAPRGPDVALATRYVAPLREGGSLPGLVEVEDGRLMVVKFRGAGQGTKALVAEWIAGTLARAAGIAVPELSLVDVPAELSRTERDEEIGDLLRASVGRNVGLGYLAGALAFERAAADPVDPELASLIVAFDSLVMNVDRTARNPNLLWWQAGLWAIDHGAALLWHHDWDLGLAGSDRSFAFVAQHVLLSFATRLDVAGEQLRTRLDDATVTAAVAGMPDDWLVATPAADPSAIRAAYVGYLIARLATTQTLIQEAIDARARL